MNREKAKQLVVYVVDDSGSGRRLYEDIYAVIREAGEGFKYGSKIVGWHESVFVSVHSYLDVEVSDTEAEEMAWDYLTEMGWELPNKADYIL